MSKSNLSEEQLASEVVFAGRMLRVERDRVRLPNGHESTREIVRHPGAVAIVALRGDDVLLVRQYRYALAAETLEIPAGKLEAGEEPHVCAERELREETGYAGNLVSLGTYYSTPGFTDERMHLFLAKDLQWAPLATDEDEFLRVEAVPWDEAVAKAVRAEFYDAKTIMGILLVQSRGLGPAK